MDGISPSFPVVRDFAVHHSPSLKHIQYHSHLFMQERVFKRVSVWVLPCSTTACVSYPCASTYSDRIFILSPFLNGRSPLFLPSYEYRAVTTLSPFGSMGKNTHKHTPFFFQINHMITSAVQLIQIELMHAKHNQWKHYHFCCVEPGLVKALSMERAGEKQRETVFSVRPTLLFEYLLNIC